MTLLETTITPSSVTPLPTLVARMETNRRLTLRFLDYLHLVARAEARQHGSRVDAEAARLLTAQPKGWQEGCVAWNLLHVAVFEAGCAGPVEEELWNRFRHGATPGGVDPVPTLAELAQRLADSRRALLRRLDEWAADGGLERPAAGTMQPAESRRRVVDSAVWHEAHHLSLCDGNLRRQLVEW
jgi:hypothetical protein